jgi:mannose/fructose/N-acetylgalactosamine-specific phosphotransferase system component IID
MSRLNKRDINRSFNRWWYANEIPNNLDYLLGPSLLYALMPTLRKLYTNDDDLRDAYFRHLSYFNTQAIWGGGTLTGIVTHLEEVHFDQSNRDLNDGEVEVNESFISMTKTGLMGVLAGVGDAVDSGCVQYIFITMGLPFAFEGNWIGALYPWIAFLLSTYSYGYYFALLGYIKGRLAAVDLVSSKRFQMITEVLSTVGLILLGTIAAQYIQLNIDTGFYLFENLSNFLINLVEGLLSLSLILIVYYYLSKKGLDLLKGMIFITIIICILMVFGIL